MKRLKMKKVSKCKSFSGLVCPPKHNIVIIGKQSLLKGFDLMSYLYLFDFNNKKNYIYIIFCIILVVVTQCSQVVVIFSC